MKKQRSRQVSSLMSRALSTAALVSTVVAPLLTGPTTRAEADEDRSLVTSGLSVASVTPGTQTLQRAFLSRSLTELGQFAASIIDEDAHYDWRDIALRDVAEGHARVGDTKGAKQTAQSIRESMERDAVFTIAVYYQVQSRQFAEAKITAQSIHEVGRRSAAFSTIAIAEAEHRDFAAARATIAIAKRLELGIKPYLKQEFPGPDRDRDILVLNEEDDVRSKIALGLAQIDDLQGAEHTVREIHDPDSQSQTRHEIANLAIQEQVRDQLQKGDVAKAKLIANAITAPASKSEALCRVASKQAQSGDLTGAQETLACTKGLESSTDAQNAMLVAESDIAVANVQAGNASDEKIPYGISRYESIQLGVISADGGDIEGAKKLAYKLDNDHVKEGSLADIALIQLYRGDVDGAKTTLQSVREIAQKIATAPPVVWEPKMRLPGYKEVVGVGIGRFGDSEEFIDEFSVKTLCHIYILQSRTGDTAGANGTLEAAKLIAGCNRMYRSGSLSVIAATQARTGDISGAQETFSKVMLTIPSLRAHKNAMYSEEAVAEIANGLSDGFAVEETDTDR